MHSMRLSELPVDVLLIIAQYLSHYCCGDEQRFSLWNFTDLVNKELHDKFNTDVGTVADVWHTRIAPLLIPNKRDRKLLLRKLQEESDYKAATKETATIEEVTNQQPQQKSSNASGSNFTTKFTKQFLQQYYFSTLQWRTESSPYFTAVNKQTIDDHDFALEQFIVKLPLHNTLLSRLFTLNEEVDDQTQVKTLKEQFKTTTKAEVIKEQKQVASNIDEFQTNNFITGYDFNSDNNATVVNNNNKYKSWQYTIVTEYEIYHVELYNRVRMMKGPILQLSPEDTSELLKQRSAREQEGTTVTSNEEEEIDEEEAAAIQEIKQKQQQLETVINNTITTKQQFVSEFVMQLVNSPYADKMVTQVSLFITSANIDADSQQSMLHISMAYDLRFPQGSVLLRGIYRELHEQAMLHLVKAIRNQIKAYEAS